MLSPTTRSPLGRSPSYSPREFQGGMSANFLKGEGLLKNSSSSNLLHTVVKAARKEAMSPGKSVFNDRKASMSVSGHAFDLTRADSTNFLFSTTQHPNLPSDRMSNFTALRPSAAAKFKKPSLTIEDVTGQGK